MTDINLEEFIKQINDRGNTFNNCTFNIQNNCPQPQIITTPQIETWNNRPLLGTTMPNSDTDLVFSKRDEEYDNIVERIRKFKPLYEVPSFPHAVPRPEQWQLNDRCPSYDEKTKNHTLRRILEEMGIRISVDTIYAIATLVIGSCVAVAGTSGVYLSRETKETPSLQECMKISDKTEEGRFCRTFQWDKELTAIEQKYQLPEGLLGAIVMVESEGSAIQLNRQKDGSAGPFQLGPEMAKENGLTVYDPENAKKYNKKYSNALSVFLQYHKWQLDTVAAYDERFDVEKSGNFVGNYLQAMASAYFSEGVREPWKMAVGAYDKEAETTSEYRGGNKEYVNLVWNYRDGYVQRKKENKHYADFD